MFRRFREVERLHSSVPTQYEEYDYTPDAAAQEKFDKLFGDDKLPTAPIISEEEDPQAIYDRLMGD